jgi:cyanophycin synthetase
MRRSGGGDRVRVGPPEVVGGQLVIDLASEHQRDRLHFSVPEGFRAHFDLVASAVAPLLRSSYAHITFDFPVSDLVRMRVAARTRAEVVSAGAGDPRQPGSRLALNFSGGVDSLAAWLLAPDEMLRVAVDYGRWFQRERKSFAPLAPDVICSTDFRAKGYGQTDWLFMAAATTLFADHLDLSSVGFGTHLAASPSYLRPREWEPRDLTAPLLSAAGLRDRTLTRGLTEFGTSLIVDRYAPDVAGDALASVGRRGSAKMFRKRLIYDSAVAFRGGPRVDIENRRLPHRKIRLWQSYGMDFALIILMALYPPEFVRRFIKNVESGVLEAARDIRPDFAFRCNPLFVQHIPAHLRDTVTRRMASAGIEMYGDADWVEYEKLRRILASHYPVPA